jgi:peroxiredoxin
MMHLLINKPFPLLSFDSTSDVEVPANISADWVVLFVHPMIPATENVLPDSWMNIPGAAGCTVQSCMFRDIYNEIKNELNTEIIGLSTQPILQQKLAKKRLSLPFELVTDDKLLLKKLLLLPTFLANGKEYYERLTMILKQGTIKKIFHPIEEPGKHIYDVHQYILNKQEKLTND